jgi:TDG/mug DNA glycosylase family protein
VHPGSIPGQASKFPMTEIPAGAAKTSFPAVADVRTRVLILGSLPGEASLRAVQYYAHPQNQFWRLMAPVIGQTLAEEPYEARLDRLREAGVGLWDVIRSARRVGSLDAAIRDHEPNSLVHFVAELPSLRAIAFNGGKASQIGRKVLAATGERHVLITLPSSSPAHASVPFAGKQAAWLALKAYL